MEDIRKERMIVVITTLAGLSCILQNFFGKWEAWVPAVILAGTVAIWWIHIAHTLNEYFRVNIYFAYTAFLVFYHGIHDTSLYDVSVVIILFIVTYTLANRMILLDLILAEYGIVMVIQFVFLYMDRKITMDAFETMRMGFHIGTVLIMYLISRITINRRIGEQHKLDVWLQKVRENDHDMEDFLSNISHELRTPVNVISGMTLILQKDIDRSELGSIGEAGIRLAHQIEDIQDYTEIKRGELVLEEENYMCISLINDVVTYYRDHYQNTGIELIIDLAPDTPTMLKGDITKLHKIFRHLLGNAFKFTRRGGVLVRVFTVPQEYGCNITIEITDTGIGMTRAQIAHLSGGMYQANKKRNRSTGGIGIGIPIVYGFVHKMGGFVRIDSERGKGTTVRISIPQVTVDPAPCLAIKDAANKNMVFFARPDRYQVPEVREFFRSMAVNMANGLKTNLYSAESAQELKHMLDERGIACVFMGQEEYERDRELIDDLARGGHRMVVSANAGFEATKGTGIRVLPKPIYGFPVARILNGEADVESDEELKGKVRFTGVSALVVDDEPMNLVVATGLLREYRMFTDTAGSGKEAIKKYENEEYDVIFMDHMMPEMDGVEAMKRIRDVASERGRDPIVIALTANALSGAREMFIQEGFDAFIAKPIDIKEFEHVMKKVLPEDMIQYEGRAEA